MPNTHSIGLLRKLVQEAGVEGIQGFANVAAFTRYAVSTRYPGEDEPVTREEAKEASRLAVRLVSWVEAQLGK
ncbi:MAG: HEPN domain-containing protein [Nitrospirota bacterium]